MQHVVAAPFFAIGDDIDAGLVLVADRGQRGLVEQLRKFGRPYLVAAAVEREAETVEQRPAVLPVDVAWLGVAADDRRQDLALLAFGHEGSMDQAAMRASS